MTLEEMQTELSAMKAEVADLGYTEPRATIDVGHDHSPYVAFILGKHDGGAVSTCIHDKTPEEAIAKMQEWIAALEPAAVIKARQDFKAELLLKFPQMLSNLSRSRYTQDVSDPVIAELTAAASRVLSEGATK